MRRMIHSLFSGFKVFAVAVVLAMGTANLASSAETTAPAQFLDDFGAQVIKVLSETAPGEARRDAELRERDAALQTLLAAHGERQADVVKQLETSLLAALAARMFCGTEEKPQTTN